MNDKLLCPSCLYCGGEVCTIRFDVIIPVDKCHLYESKVKQESLDQDFTMGDLGGKFNIVWEDD